MEIRKIIQFGGNSFVISLPKKWVENNNLSKGDAVYIDTENDELIIKSGLKQEKSKKIEIEIKLDSKTKEKSVKRKLFHAYVNGATKIVFYSEDINKFSEMINFAAEKYIALEIVEQTNNKIVAKTYVNTDDVKLDNFVRRIDNTIRSMIIDLESCFKDEGKNIKEISSTINQREESIDKIKRLVYRVIKERLNNPSLQKFETPLKLLKYWDAVKILEKISNLIRFMTTLISDDRKLNGDKKLNGELKNSCKEISNLKNIFNEIMNCFYKEDFEKSDKISSTIEILRKELLKNLNNKSYEQKQLILNLLENMRDLNRLSH
ncbi:MAG: AbrB/MazE/SpoVT family DNA-binding domain-containing protein [Candidatus Woesearchaeota archaeon]